MLISELISELQIIRSEHGDLPVYKYEESLKPDFQSETHAVTTLSGTETLPDRVGIL